MTSSNSKPKGQGKKTEYAVGYKKPPESHRFQKGQSGNPSGRSRQSREVAGELERLNRIMLDEAYRPLPVRVGGKTTTLPAIQANVRALVLAGASGNRRAAKEVIALVGSIESLRAQRSLDNFAALLRYKSDMEELIKRRQQQGLDISDILPHPDDIIINDRTGEARIKGPLNEEERGFFQDIRRKHDELAKFLADMEKLLAITRSDKQRETISAIIKRSKIRLRRYSEFLATYDSDRNAAG
jgi:hypothetical protein